MDVNLGTTRNLEINLISLLNELLLLYNDKTKIEIEPVIGDGYRYRPDIVATLNGYRVVIELKLFRTRHISSIVQAINYVLFYKKAGEFDSALLVVTSIIDESILNRLELQYGIQIWDRSRLYHISGIDSVLRERLQVIISESKQFGDEDIFSGISPLNGNYIEKLWNIHSIANSGEQPPSTDNFRVGERLINQIRSTTAGRDDYKKFEIACEDLLKYLFNKELTGWRSQNKTSDDLHQFDLVARIISVNDFWRSVSRDFRSRVVVFEFKNYTNPITQKEIYSTEKYLYSNALRSLAIIIAREGCDVNSKIAMQGALRENGKLIIVLSLQDLIQMATMQDEGDDPHTLLAEKLDDILMTLSR